MPADDIIAIMDLEFTAWEGSSARRWSAPGEEMEIVQIGATRHRNDDALSEIEALDVLVKPLINPELSDYFIELTGITQEQVDTKAISFCEALDRLVAFFGNDTKAVYSWGQDYLVLQRNCQLNDLDFPYDGSLFENARDPLRQIMESELESIFSSNLPEILGFPSPGTAHQGLGDCRCIAGALRVARRKEVF